GPKQLVHEDGTRQTCRIAAGPIGLEVDARAPLDRRSMHAPGPGRRPDGDASAQAHYAETSDINNGGQCRCVTEGSRPTTSVAISSASRIVDAGLNPSRRTAAGSPPTMITPPRWSSACAPQYHM